MARGHEVFDSTVAWVMVIGIVALLILVAITVREGRKWETVPPRQTAPFGALWAAPSMQGMS